MHSQGKVSGKQAMVAGMAPELVAGDFCFCTMTDDDERREALIFKARATFREAEGLSLILASDVAIAAGFAPDPAMRQITLNVYSSLEGVGLTATVATALANAGIACNMVAAYHHDHAFVPSDKAEQALVLLQDLTKGQQL